MTFPHLWTLICILNLSLECFFLRHPPKPNPTTVLLGKHLPSSPAESAAPLKHWTPTAGLWPTCLLYLTFPAPSVVSVPGHRGRKEHKSKGSSTPPSLVSLSSTHFPSPFSCSLGLCFPGSRVIWLLMVFGPWGALAGN